MKKRIKPGLRLSVCSIVLVVAACSQHGSDQTTDRSMETESNSTVDTGMTWTQQIAGAVDDLSQSNGDAPDSITVSEARAVEWGTSAMGCPQPDMSYMEVITPGLRVVLEVNDKKYLYHGKNGSDLFLCPKDRAQMPAYGRGKDIW